MERATIVVGGAEMLATRKLDSSGPFSKKLRNASVRFGSVPAEHFPHAFHKSSGNGHVSSNGHGESLAAGFLLLDTSLRPIYVSEEALAILAYPGLPPKNGSFGSFLKSKIRSLLLSHGNHYGFSHSKFLNEVASGRRCYQLRAFSVKSNLGIRRGPAIALLLERNHQGALNLESFARKFRLTQRERETVNLLFQDLSTKQIAGRMNISPNTAKAFIRSVMIKVGAENRTGIIGRILQALKSKNGETSL
jgi:DNA-binding CsgD family transcriptional regulator